MRVGQAHTSPRMARGALSVCAPVNTVACPSHTPDLHRQACPPHGGGLRCRAGLDAVQKEALEPAGSAPQSRAAARALSRASGRPLGECASEAERRELGQHTVVVGSIPAGGGGATRAMRPLSPNGPSQRPRYSSALGAANGGRHFARLLARLAPASTPQFRSIC